MTKETKKENLIITIGRRKTAVATSFIHNKKGNVVVNGLPIEEYFKSLRDLSRWSKPFHLVGISHPTSIYDISIKVRGSSKPSQLDAVILALSRALAKINDEYSSVLRKNGFLTRDSRMVERKKYYLKKSRKSPQYSKR